MLVHPLEIYDCEVLRLKTEWKCPDFPWALWRMIRAYDVSSNTNQKQAQHNRQHPIRKRISLNALTFMFSALRKFPSNSSAAHILWQRVWYTEFRITRIRGLFNMKAHCHNAHFNSCYRLLLCANLHIDQNVTEYLTAESLDS